MRHHIIFERKSYEYEINEEKKKINDEIEN
jgi:hypothetical protein